MKHSLPELQCRSCWNMKVLKCLVLSLHLADRSGHVSCVLLFLMMHYERIVVVDCALQDMELGWQIVVGSIVGFLGAAFGSVGGVGGGGIFVPMLTLIIGFDPKSATAISKCKKKGYYAYLLKILKYKSQSLTANLL